MRNIAIYLFACGFAALVPFASYEPDHVPDETTFHGWPTEFQGKPIEQLQLSERERAFASGFPGRVAKFTDGSRMLIMRWVTKRTRKLHPASHCFKGMGYTVRPLPIRIDSQGVGWGCIEAKKNGRHLVVCERIFDNLGNAWTDVSSWYWAALMNRTRGTWWALTVVKNR